MFYFCITQTANSKPTFRNSLYGISVRKCGFSCRNVRMSRITRHNILTAESSYVSLFSWNNVSKLVFLNTSWDAKDAIKWIGRNLQHIDMKKMLFKSLSIHMSPSSTEREIAKFSVRFVSPDDLWLLQFEINSQIFRRMVNVGKTYCYLQWYIFKYMSSLFSGKISIYRKFLGTYGFVFLSSQLSGNSVEQELKCTSKRDSFI